MLKPLSRVPSQHKAGIGDSMGSDTQAPRPSPLRASILSFPETRIPKSERSLIENLEVFIDNGGKLHPGGRPKTEQNLLSSVELFIRDSRNGLFNTLNHFC